jgi:hypothetical protein
MKFRRIIGFLILINGFLFLTGTLLQLKQKIFQQEEISNPHPRENFDPVLIRLQSLDQLTTFVDSVAIALEIPKDSLVNYVEIADSIVGLRFYYGLQNYSFSENFLANLAGKYLWKDFGAKVDPNHILQGRKAFCSQSAIVFQAVLHKKGINTRSVRLPNHFATEVLINGRWAFHDVSYKPALNRHPRLSTMDLIENPQYLNEAYLFSFNSGFMDILQSNFNLEKVKFDKVNAFPAKRMLWFHRITNFLSYFGWALFLGIGLIFLRIEKQVPFSH